MNKQVHDYEGYYEVSDTGEVIGLEREVEVRGAKKRLIKRRVLEQRANSYGYMTVRLSKGNITKTFFVHRLVATAFIENPDGLPIINHKSGDKEDNSVVNLEWSTVALNTQHAYDMGLNKHKGKGHSFACGVIDNELGQEFSTIREWCAARGINYNTGRNFLNGQVRSPRCIELNIENIKKVKA